MIIDIFVPEKFGTYYVIPKRILGFDLSKTYVYASQLYLSGQEIILEKFYQEQLDTNLTRPYSERVSEAIKKIIDKTGNYDVIKTSLSSSVVMFKELQLPFSNPEKIALIINYEVESYLPFPIDTAIIDFIITESNESENTAVVMVAAVQKQYIAEHLSYFESAGLNPNKVTVDLFDLYALYKEIPSYTQKNETVALIDIEFNVTRIAFIAKGQLKSIRTLPKGIVSITKNIAQLQEISNAQALEDIIRFGVERYDSPDFEKSIKEAFNNYFKDIKFTLQSFLTQASSDQKFDRILLLGKGAEINKIDNFISKSLDIQCNLFDGNALIKIPSVILKNSTRIPRSNIMSLSTAYPSTITEHFNLLKEEFAPSKAYEFNKKFLTAITLLSFIFLALFTHNYLQQRKLKKTISTMEREVISTLNQQDLSEEKNLSKAIEEAEDKVAKEEELWFAFSRQRRFSFLKTLQDLSMAIDRKSTGLDLKKLIITPNELTFEGEVRGFEELKVLERELRESNLFQTVPTLQELKFSEKLLLKKNGEES
ncbi:MAG: pilus assembly protein PilM [Candidatus Babeliales bacterium]